jgi:hypothetical protein
MKLALIILVVWAVNVNSNPVEDPEAEINRIAGVIDEIVKLIPDHELGSINVKTIVFKGFDSNCIAKKVQAHKLQSYFSFEDVTDVTITTEINTFLIVAASIFPCSTTRDELVSLFFDAANIFVRLINLYKDDIKFMPHILTGMPCRINYAIKHNYLDLSKYPEISYSHDSEITKECEENTEAEISMVKALAEAPSSTKNTDCVMKESQEQMKVLFFKYAILLYLGVSEEHKNEIKTEFSNEIVSRHDQQLKCFTQEETDNSITDAR